MQNSFDGKTVMITGSCGTVGKEILHQLSQTNVKKIIGLDINENEIFYLSDDYKNDHRISIYLGSLRNKDSLSERMKNVDIILHTAALKHVSLCEESPRDAILTNIIGTNNLIDAAVDAKVQRVLFTSSDKAVNPTNVMGTSKLMGERLMTAATGGTSNGMPIFASTRFGNVLGSRGSVVPIFQKQIEAGGPVRLTDTDMSRFIMTLKDAVRLVLGSVFLAVGGEVFVTKMPVVRIEDLALAMIDLLAPNQGIKLEVMGTRPGEKMYEELFNEEEMRRTLEIDNYYVIKPALAANQNELDGAYEKATATQRDAPYNSAHITPMSVEEIKEYFLLHKILN